MYVGVVNSVNSVRDNVILASQCYTCMAACVPWQRMNAAMVVAAAAAVAAFDRQIPIFVFPPLRARLLPASMHRTCRHSHAWRSFFVGGIAGD